MRRVLGVASLLVSTLAWGAPVPADDVVELSVANDPTVSFRLWFKVGSQDDPPGKEGLAWLTAAMLTEASTQKNSYERIVDKLFPLAASYDSTAGVEMTVIHGRVHKDNLDEYYRLLLDAVVRPAFKAEDLERLRAERLSFIENTLRYASDEELGKAVLYDKIYAGTPYGHLGMGTVKALKSITVDDVRKFHREHYTRDNVVIGIGGGHDAKLVSRLRADLGALPAGTPPVAPKPAPRLPPGIKVTLVEKDSASTAISAGFPIDVVRGPREWYALAIANSWLGEHRNSSSHLYQVIREIARPELRRLQLHRAPAQRRPRRPLAAERAAPLADLRGLDPAGAQRHPPVRPARGAARGGQPGAQRHGPRGVRADAQLPAQIRPAIRDDDDGAARLGAR
jgi:zinc protease